MKTYPILDGRSSSCLEEDTHYTTSQALVRAVSRLFYAVYEQHNHQDCFSKQQQQLLGEVYIFAFPIILVHEAEDINISHTHIINACCVLRRRQNEGML